MSYWLFLGERLFFDAEQTSSYEPCQDSGIYSFRERPPSSLAFDALLLVPVCVAFNATASLLSSWMSHGAPPFDANPALSPVRPWLLSLWGMATSASLFSLLLFGRSPMSFVIKFVHVLLETWNLSFLASYLGLHRVTLSLVLVSVFALASALSMPCTTNKKWTSIGVVLDTANVVVYAAWFAAKRALRRPEVVFYLTAFFLHASYIWAFLIMQYGTESPATRSLLRWYGVWANAGAVHSVDRVDALLRGKPHPTAYALVRDNAETYALLGTAVCASAVGASDAASFLTSAGVALVFASGRLAIGFGRQV